MNHLCEFGEGILARLGFCPLGPRRRKTGKSAHPTNVVEHV